MRFGFSPLELAEPGRVKEKLALSKERRKNRQGGRRFLSGYLQLFGKAAAQLMTMSTIWMTAA